LFLLARPLAATKAEEIGWPRAVSEQLLAVSIGVISVTKRLSSKLATPQTDRRTNDK
jgi:hypothetical protein